MTHKTVETERKFVAVLLAATLLMLAITQPVVAASPQQTPGAASLKARVRELYAQGSQVQLKFADKSEVRGRIIRIEEDSFAIRQEKTDQEMVLRYERVSQVSKKGLSRGGRAAVIGAIVGGAVFIVLCAAPYPIGALCHKDPD
jgi:hypothetical protein